MSVMGILNGTTNYILTRMQEESLSFDAALADAQAGASRKPTRPSISRDTTPGTRSRSSR